MPTNVNAYQCDFCKKYFESLPEAENCESKHLKNPRIQKIAYGDEAKLQSSRDIMLPTFVVIDYDFRDNFILHAHYRFDFTNEQEGFYISKKDPINIF